MNDSRDRFKKRLIIYDFLRISEQEYANLEVYMKRRMDVLLNWGAKIEPGDSLLELGCMDGYFLCQLAKEGFRCEGIDISPKAINFARERAKKDGLSIDFYISDIEDFNYTSQYDCVFVLMRHFYAYVDDPIALLEKLFSITQKKLVVDLNPRREIPISEAIRQFEEVGFVNVGWRSYFVSLSRKMPKIAYSMLIICEALPIIRDLLLKFRGSVSIKGEKPMARKSLKKEGIERSNENSILQ